MFEKVKVWFQNRRMKWKRARNLGHKPDKPGSKSNMKLAQQQSGFNYSTSSSGLPDGSMNYGYGQNHEEDDEDDDDEDDDDEFDDDEEDETVN